MKDRYVVAFRAWDGQGYETYAKSFKTKGSAIGFTEHVLKQVAPYQISITDTRSLCKKPEEVENETVQHTL